MKRILLSSMIIVGSASAFADIDHSQLINFAGGHTTGNHLSQLEAGETVIGFGVQSTVPNTTADDFTVGAQAFHVTGIAVFAYVTGATAPTITAVNWAIGAAPTTTLTNSSVTGAFWNVGGKDVYRCVSGDSTSVNRKIQIAEVTGLNFNLAANSTNYLSYNTVGGNFSPPLPLSLSTYGKNMTQSAANGPFNPVLSGPNGTDMAFIIRGEVVPEPATMLALVAGIAAMARKRRK